MLGGQATCRDLSARVMTELSNVSVTALKGVGEAMAEKLAKVGLENVQDAEHGYDREEDGYGEDYEKAKFHFVCLKHRPGSRYLNVSFVRFERSFRPCS